MTVIREYIKNIHKIENEDDGEYSDQECEEHPFKPKLSDVCLEMSRRSNLAFAREKTEEEKRAEQLKEIDRKVEEKMKERKKKSQQEKEKNNDCCCVS